MLKSAANVVTIAMLRIGVGVHFYKISGQYNPYTEYIVSYGESVSNSTDFKQMYEEYVSCCQHCLESEGMI